MEKIEKDKIGYSKDTIHVLNDHECPILEKRGEKCGIAVQQYSDGRWYWVDFDRNGMTILNQISYCPYCGCNLEELSYD